MSSQASNKTRAKRPKPLPRWVEKSWRDAVRRAGCEIDSATGEQNMFVMARTLVSLAKQGDVASLKEFGDRVDGRTQGTLENAGAQTFNFVVALPAVAKPDEWGKRALTLDAQPMRQPRVFSDALAEQLPSPSSAHEPTASASEVRVVPFARSESVGAAIVADEHGPVPERGPSEREESNDLEGNYRDEHGGDLVRAYDATQGDVASLGRGEPDSPKHAANGSRATSGSNVAGEQGQASEEGSNDVILADAPRNGRACVVAASRPASEGEIAAGIKQGQASAHARVREGGQAGAREGLAAESGSVVDVSPSNVVEIATHMQGQ